ncbi:efflux transporter outer membrane subunit [Asticcacaulis sp. W401b]|uniref:efflux transporter outer membrane subunit n=1 Tax=Asticcacaulis sp. W401b TaxID=3388666 RepID=UPI0039707D43
MRNILLNTSLVALLLAGCAANPQALTPAVSLPTTYSQRLDIDTGNAADADWRAIFNDARLQALIEHAVHQNHDLRLALLNVEEARAQHRITRSAGFPSLDASVSQTRSRAPDPFSGQLTEQEQNGASVNLSAFELDLFGRLRAQSSASFERYLATEEGRAAAQIALISAVAEAYINESAAQAQLTITEATLGDWRQSYELTRTLHAAGQVGRLELSQSEGLVRQAESDLEAARRGVAQANGALQLVVGGAFPPDLPKAQEFMRLGIQTQLPVGLPSDLLTNRPDIRQAERLLQAANADVYAARAAFFPQITLTGNYGVGSTDLDKLFSGNQRVWSFTPQISVPLFRGGALKGELRLASVRQSSAVVTYEKTVAVAFKEVSDGLAARATYANQITAQQLAVDASTLRLRLSKERYKAGFDSRLELLDAQRSDYASHQSLLQMKQQEYMAAIALYRALGGGAPNVEQRER